MTASISSMAASSVRISNLHKSYGKVQVLKGIDMQVEPGEVVCLIGPSGSGKSTLLRCVNLLEEPNDGTIMVGDTEVTDPDVDINRVRTHMGMVFQQFNLFPNYTALKNVALAPTLNGTLNAQQAQERARELLAKVGLEGRSLVIVTHNMAFAKKVADRIVFLENGTLRYNGEPTGFFASDDERIRKFLTVYDSTEYTI